MNIVTPAQLSALRDATTDARGELRRTRGPKGAGYAADATTVLHTPVSVFALAREGLLAEHSPGFQSVFVVTEAGRRVVEANQRAQQAIACARQA